MKPRTIQPSDIWTISYILELSDRQTDCHTAWLPYSSNRFLSQSFKLRLQWFHILYQIFSKMLQYSSPPMIIRLHQRNVIWITNFLPKFYLWPNDWRKILSRIFVILSQSSYIVAVEALGSRSGWRGGIGSRRQEIGDFINRTIQFCSHRSVIPRHPLDRGDQMVARLHTYSQTSIQRIPHLSISQTSIQRILHLS